MSIDPFAPLPTIETHLDQVAQWPDAPAALRDAVRYALLQGGKRLRPVLAWQAAVACGGRGEASLIAGAAVELVHAFSLVHDDLPAIDDDDLRRGRPTLHRHAGEAMAILAGDAMLASAFELLAARAIDATVGLRLLRELTDATMAMIHGQVWDTLGGMPSALSPEAQLRLIHRNKTGALIRAACRMGALSVLGPAAETEPRLAAIDRFARAVGLMYQVVDDLIDVEQPTEVAGKRTGKDAEAGKLTYPSVLGLVGTRSEISRLEVEALDALNGLGSDARSLAALASYLARRSA